MFGWESHVDKSFDNEEAVKHAAVMTSEAQTVEPESAEPSKSTGVKRKRETASKAARLLRGTFFGRQQAWLRRRCGGADPASWRPLKQHRVASKRYLHIMDNQLRVSSPNPGGLSYYFKDDDVPLWSDENWRKWPHLCLGMDQGADGLSAGWAGVYFFKLNLTLVFDPSHGANKDVDLAIKRVGVDDFWRLMMVSWNLPMGPNNDCQRCLAVREAVDSLFKILTPSTFPLFAANQSQIVAG